MWRTQILFACLCVVFAISADAGGRIDGGGASTIFRKSFESLASTSTRALKAFDLPFREIASASAGRAVGRALLQDDHHSDSNSTCEWSNAGTCVLSHEATHRLLEPAAADSEIGKFLLGAAECYARSNEDDCFQAGCSWRGTTCGPLEGLFADEAVQTCTGDAALFYEIGNMGRDCKQAHNDTESCNADTDCSWDVGDEECGFDIWFGLVGIQSANSTPSGYKEAEAAMVASFKESKKDVISILLDPNPTDILDWEIPEFQCPEGVEQIVCDFLAPMGEAFKAGLYCGRRFSDVDTQCDQDPLCRPINAICGASYQVEAAVNRKQLEVLVKTVGNPRIEELVGPLILCRGESFEKCVDSCMWVDETDTCELNEGWIMRKISGIAGEMDLPMCKIMAGMWGSGCIGITESECAENEKCDWEGGCSLRTDLVIEIMLSADPATRPALLTHKQCLAETDESSCVALAA